MAHTRFGQGLLPAAERNFFAGSEHSGNRNLCLPAVLRGSPDVPVLAKLSEKRRSSWAESKHHPANSDGASVLLRMKAAK